MGGTPEGPPQPGPGGVISTILDFTKNLLGNPSDPLDPIRAAVNTTWANLVATSAFLYTAIAGIRDFLKKLATVLFGGIIHIISDVLHGRLNKALQDLEVLLRNIHNLFAPLLDYLHRLQRIQRQRQMLAMKSALNLIQRIRKILVPLRILHVKFAQKLDGWLAGIESRIITRETAIVAKTNEIIGWIDIITDPTGVLRGPAVLQGVAQFMDAFLGALGAVGVGNVIPARRKLSGPPLVARPFSDWSEPFFKTAATSPSWYEQFNTVVDVWYARAKEGT